MRNGYNKKIKKQHKNIFSLYQALYSLKKRDLNPMRQQMFHYLKQEKIRLRIIEKIYKILPPLLRLDFIWFGSLYYFLKLPKVIRNEKKIGICFYPNETKSLENFDQTIKTFVSHYNFKFFIPNLKLIRLAYIFAKQKDILFGIRGFSLVLNYVFLQKTKPRFTELYGSSEGCPAVYAYLAFAHSYNIPSTFIAHGLCQKNPEKIIYKNIYLKNTRDVNRYKKKFNEKNVFCLLNESFQNTNPATENKIGIIGSNMMNWDYFKTLCQSLKQTYPTHKIILRRHPNEIIKIKKNALAIEANSPLLECEFIIGGNSSYLEELRLKNKKVFYDSKLDFAPHDAYGLIEDKLIPQFPSI